MALSATTGQSQTLDGREASAQATHQALRTVENDTISAAFIFASDEYDFKEVYSGATALLGEVPILGISTSGQLYPGGHRQRSVVVTLLTGEGVTVRTGWWDSPARNPRNAIQALGANLLPQDHHDLLFLLGDGLTSNGDDFCNALPEVQFVLAGGLAGGNLDNGQTYQIGGGQVGRIGPAGARRSGRLRAGVGMAHGWEPVGARFPITSTEGAKVKLLEDTLPAEIYARLFGHHPSEWGAPPLNRMVRLYPLGIEVDGYASLNIRSGLFIENDGSLRMNAPIPQDAVGHLLVGSARSCLEAARKAARQAQENLGPARPFAALVLVDVAGKMLLESQPGAELQAIREVLGPDLPIAGGYTLGQFARHPEDGQPAFFNQHIQVLLLGEARWKGG